MGEDKTTVVSDDVFVAVGDVETQPDGRPSFATKAALASAMLILTVPPVIIFTTMVFG